MPNSCPTPDGLAITSNPLNQPFLDEISPIAEYMAREMTRNVHSPVVRHMKYLNSSSDLLKSYADKLVGFEKFKWPVTKAEQMTTRAAAMVIWTRLVMQDSDWDHKPVIGSCFHPRARYTQEYHGYANRRYYYDIWSNIHYGYIGAAAGFNQRFLLDGAGLEQIGSDVSRLSWPKRKTKHPTGLLRDFDDSDDRVSIQLGIQLFKKYPGGIGAVILLDSVLKSAISYRKVSP